MQVEGSSTAAMMQPTAVTHPLTRIPAMVTREKHLSGFCWDSPKCSTSRFGFLLGVRLVLSNVHPMSHIQIDLSRAPAMKPHLMT